MQHVSGAQAMRVSALLKMEDTVAITDRLEEQLIGVLNPAPSYPSLHFSSSSYKNRKWWVSILLHIEGGRNASPLLALQATIEQGREAYRRFRTFSDIRGLILLVGVEFDEMQAARLKALKGELGDIEANNGVTASDFINYATNLSS